MTRPTDTRLRLLEAAIDLLWASSFGSVSVDQICEKAGVKKGSFYHFFASKTDLALAAYEHGWEQHRAELDRVFSAQSPPLQRLADWCAAMVAEQRGRAALTGHVPGCPISSVGAEMSTQDERLRMKAADLLERGRAYVVSTLRDAHARGDADIPDPDASANAIQSLMLGKMLQAKLANDVRVLEDLHGEVLALVAAKPAPRA